MAKMEMFECPKCGGFNAIMDDYEIDEDGVFLELSCPDCDASWREHGTLTYTGYHYNGENYDQDGRKADV